VTHLFLSFLGSFQVTLAEEPITSFRSSKVQGLLVYLAMTSPQVHEREELATLLWPEQSDTVAKRNLRQSLYQLRKVLDEANSGPAPYLIVTRTTAQFNPDSDYSLDVEEFLGTMAQGQLEEASGLYHGDLLVGFSCDSSPFEDWLRREKERLHQLALGALYELTRMTLERADFRRGQALAQRQLALEPWREEAHRQLIQVLALLGDRSAALAQYDTCKAILDKELGVKPSAETEALAARIRAEGGRPIADTTRERSPRSRRLELAFVGRASEHGTLVRAYERSIVEGPQVVALIGEAGIGKTRLAEQFLVWATAQGADILRGRAFETSGGLSYQPLTQALRQRLERVNAPEDLLSDLWLSQIARILPELRDRYPDLPEPTQDEGTARHHLLEAITRLCQSLAKRSPMVLFLDDWHWADSASMDALHYAAMGWSESHAPILVLLTMRQQALADRPDLSVWLSRLNHDIDSYQLHLGTLSEEDTGRMIQAMVTVGTAEAPSGLAGIADGDASDRFAHWLFEETEGQPFFLVETLSTLIDNGLLHWKEDSETWFAHWPTIAEQVLGSKTHISQGLWERMQVWVSRVSDPANDLLSAAAVLGEHATFGHLCQVAEMDEEPALNAVDELLSRQLLHETKSASPGLASDVVYSFSHQKLSELVYAEAGAARRHILHRRAFDALFGEDLPAAALAFHAFHSSLWEECIEYSIAAGDEAMDLIAVRVAIPHFETAERVAKEHGWPESMPVELRRRLYVGLGRAYELDEAWDSAERTYRNLIAEARSVNEATVECDALNRLATVYTNGHNDATRAIPVLEAARSVAEKSGDQRGLAETEWSLSLVSRIQRDSSAARRHGETALSIARELDERPLIARCLNSLAYVYARMRQWDRVGRYADEALEICATAGNRILEADSQRMAGWSRLLSGQPAESLALLRATYAFSQEIGNLWGEAEASWRLAGALMESGDYGKGIVLAKQGARQAREVGHPTMVELALTTLGSAQRTIMALDAARQTLIEAVATVDVHGLASYGDWALGELCAVHAMTGHWKEAGALASKALLIRRENGLLPMGLITHYEITALLRDDDTLARDEVERIAGAVGNMPRYHLLLLRCQATLAQWDGAVDRAVADLQSAAAIAGEIGLPGEEWSVLAQLGDLYDLKGDQEAARQARRSAAEVILRLADTIDDEVLRKGFVGADIVRSILQSSESS